MKIRIYTDGACSHNPGPGGWASVFNTEKGCKVISGNEKRTTNNRMELKAVVESVKKILKTKDVRLTDFEIFSDSAYVVNAINNGWIYKWARNGWLTSKDDDVKNRDLWETLSELLVTVNSARFTLSFIKIKGHSGNSFNELADRIAKEEVLKIKEG